MRGKKKSSMEKKMDKIRKKKENIRFVHRSRKKEKGGKK